MSEISEMYARFFQGSKYEAKFLRAAPPVAVVIPIVETKMGRIPRWVGDELERAKEAYESGTKLSAVASDLRTSPGRLSQLAAQHGWRPRHHGPNRSRPFAQMRAGIQMDVELETHEENAGEVWKVTERVITRVIRVRPGASTADLFSRAAKEDNADDE